MSRLAFAKNFNSHSVLLSLSLQLDELANCGKEFTVKWFVSWIMNISRQYFVKIL